MKEEGRERGRGDGVKQSGSGSGSVVSWTESPPGSSVHGILQARILECFMILMLKSFVY